MVGRRTSWSKDLQIRREDLGEADASRRTAQPEPQSLLAIVLVRESVFSVVGIGDRSAIGDFRIRSDSGSWDSIGERIEDRIGIRMRIGD